MKASKWCFGVSLVNLISLAGPSPTAHEPLESDAPAVLSYGAHDPFEPMSQVCGRGGRGTGAQLGPSGDVYLSEGGWMNRLAESGGHSAACVTRGGTVDDSDAPELVPSPRHSPGSICTVWGTCYTLCMGRS